jgi:hypothetical protein
MKKTLRVHEFTFIVNACVQQSACSPNGRHLGNKIVPERIRENRQPYYDALREADQRWDEGQLSAYLGELLKGQLTDA